MWIRLQLGIGTLWLQESRCLCPPGIWTASVAHLSQDLSAPDLMLSCSIECEGPVPSLCALRFSTWPPCTLVSHPVCMLTMSTSLHLPPPCVYWQWPRQLCPNRTPGTWFCLCVARPNLCPVFIPGCSVEWAGPGHLPLQIGRYNKEVHHQYKALFALTISKPAWAPSSWVRLGFSSLSLCLSGFPSRKGACLLHSGPRDCDAQIVSQSAPSPGWGSTCVDLLFLIDLCQGHRSWPDACFSPSYLFLWRSSLHLCCIGDLLPLPN